MSTTSPGVPGAPILPEQPIIENKGRPLSLVWIAPIVAVLVVVWIAWSQLHERGPLVEIRFANAGGVEEGTSVRYKDVTVGMVEEVRLTEDAGGVTVFARLDPELAPFLGETTSFWIAGVQVTAQAVTGLETLLSGAYIGIAWEGDGGKRRRVFEGAAVPPPTPPGTPGRRVTLIAERAGSLDVGTPVYYRELAVGRLESRDLTDDGDAVVFTAFVDAPYDRFVSPATRFWNASGVDIRADANGVTVDLDSIVTIIVGGVSFGEVGGGLGAPIESDQESFTLFSSRSDAEESLFSTEDEEGYRFIAEFDQSVSGLRTGAAITYSRIRIGTVVDVYLDVAGGLAGNSRTYAVLQFQPQRMGLGGLGDEALRDRFEAFAEGGTRVQLATGNVLTGTLSVRLVDVPDAAPAEIDYAANPYPSFPTVASPVEAITSDVQTIIAKVAALPLEELVGNAAGTMASLQAVLAQPELQQAPVELTAALVALTEAAERLEATSAGFGAGSELQVELIDAIREFRQTAAALGDLAQTIEEQPNALILGRD